MNSSVINNEMKKSILNIKYLAYMFNILIIIGGFFASSYLAYRLYNIYSELKIGITLWLIIVYTVSFMILWGVKDVLIILDNLYKGNIFTFENAKIIKRIDNKLVFTLIFSIITNIIMALLNYSPLYIIIIWLIFILFILAGHILVKALGLIVEKSAELQIEMELTI